MARESRNDSSRATISPRVALSVGPAWQRPSSPRDSFPSRASSISATRSSTCRSSSSVEGSSTLTGSPRATLWQNVATAELDWLH